MRLQILALLVLCAVTLSACACPHPPSYQGVPYDEEHTSGTGLQENGCIRRAFS